MYYTKIVDANIFPKKTYIAFYLNRPKLDPKEIIIPLQKVSQKHFLSEW